MKLLLLGPVEATVDGRPLALGRRQERALLAIMASRPGQFVSADRMADLLWDDHPPQRARVGLQSMVSHLRAALRTADSSGPQLRSGRGGYALDIDPGDVDVHQFRTLIAAADTCTVFAERAQMFATALQLWRGVPMSDTFDAGQLTLVLPDVEELYRTAREGLLEAQLDCGGHRTAIADLTTLVTEQPLRERPVELLMVALHRAGRSGEALDAYRGLAGRLSEELGIDPGETAQRLHLAVLRDDPILATSTSPSGANPRAPGELRVGDKSLPGAAVTASLGRIPSHLPASIRIFEGRADRLAELDALAAGDDGAPIVVISGMGGVGKTALAVRWASSAADQFPDGQLFVDLRGFDGRQPLTSLEALTRLLVAAGVPPMQVPTEPDTAAGMYRALLAYRRAIVVLDNARSAAQVRELLPGGRHTMVLVTSRDSLTGLVARDDARAMPIGVLQPEESVALFERLFTPAGLASQPTTTGQLADLCGHLPLAIRILAANLTTGTGRTPAQMVSILRAGTRLSALHIRDDPASALAGVFEHSYRPLGNPERRLFRLLGAAPCVDYTTGAATALAGGERAQVAAVLRQLVAANLVIEVDVDRIGFHDLIRELARSYSAAEDGVNDLADASDRLIAWYTGLGVAAHRVINPRLAPVVPAIEIVDGPFPFGDDPSAAMAFVGAETANILAVTRHAGDRGRDEAAWQIVSSLFYALERGGSVKAAIDLDSEALAIAVRRGDPIGERRARINLGAAYNNARRPMEAIPHLERGGELARQQGARNSEASASCNLGVSYKILNDEDAALAAFLRADDLRPSAPDCAVLNNIGNIYRNRGELDLAATYLNRGLQVARATGIGSDEAMSLDNIGCLEFAQGHYEAALQHLHAAYNLAHAVGAARTQVTTDIDLAKVKGRLGRPDASRMHLNRAMDVARQTGNTQREQEILLALARLAEEPTATTTATLSAVGRRSRRR